MANPVMSLTAEHFNRLLEWLSGDRDHAARRYEQIRSRLIRIFICRGCSVPEELADETIDRVAGKLPQIVGRYVGDPAPYFYGVAEKIYLEHARKRSTCFPPEQFISEQEIELKYECLDLCMERLSPRNRELILGYYGTSERTRGLRKELAARFGIGANALWIRAHRIREGLRRCVSGCFQEKHTNRQKGLVKNGYERHSAQ